MYTKWYGTFVIRPSPPKTKLSQGKIKYIKINYNKKYIK
jgi:hypothetical protein